MCLALIAINQHPRHPIIILSNRDEFYKRATSVAHYWQDDPDLFAGKDLVGGGTWLGVNKQRGFALITNFRNPNAYSPLMLSRGLLVRDYLLAGAKITPAEYIKEIAPVSHNYNPFNLIVGTKNEIVYYSNVTNQAQSLTTGLYGLSNHLLDTPWYKVLRAKALFTSSKDKLRTCTNPGEMNEVLLPILADKTLAPDDLLPKTGVPADLEKGLSSIFVELPNHNYGTRSSTIVLFEENNIIFSEVGWVET